MHICEPDYRQLATDLARVLLRADSALALMAGYTDHNVEGNECRAILSALFARPDVKALLSGQPAKSPSDNWKKLALAFIRLWSDGKLTKEALAQLWAESGCYGAEMTARIEDGPQAEPSSQCEVRQPSAIAENVARCILPSGHGGEHNLKIEARAASPWVSVSERLPRTMKFVIVWNGNCQWVATLGDDDRGRLWYIRGGKMKMDLEEVTHWMLLPSPPTADTHKGE